MPIALHLHQVMHRQDLSEVQECAKLIEYAEFLRGADKPYPFLKREFPVNMMIYCRESKAFRHRRYGRRFA